MKHGISLYKLITDEFRNLMSVNTVDMMNIISHQIEDIVMDNNLPVDFYAGFQRYSYFLRQLPRYERLAKSARRIYVFGIPDVTPPVLPGIEFIPLDENDALADEWFLTVNAPYFYTALLTREIEGQDALSGNRRFEGVWTHDERTVEQAYLVVSQLLGTDYQPIRQRDHRQQNDYIVSIATNLVNRLEGSNLARAHSQRLATAITDVAGAVAEERSYEAMLDDVTTNLQSGFKARTVTLWQTHDNAGEMQIEAAAGLPDNWRQAMYRQQQLEGSGIPAATVLQSGEIRYVADTVKEKQPDPFDPAVRSIVAIPLQARSKTHGALQLTSHLPNAYDSETLNVLQAIGSQIALAMLGIEEKGNTNNAVKSVSTKADIQWTVLDSTLDGIVVLSEQKDVRFINNAASHLLGIDERNALIGKTAVSFDHPDLQQAIASLSIENHQTVYHEMTSAQGKRILLAVAPSYSGGDVNRLSHWILVMRDMAAAMGSGNELSPVAHELMGSLQTVNDLVAQLTSEGELSTDQQALTNQISNLNQKMESVVSNLALLERITSSDIEMEPIDLKTLLTELVLKFQGEAKKRNLNLKEMVSEKVPMVQGNRQQITRAIYHLIDNAIKYSPTGANILVLAKQEDGFTTVAVRDTGMGIWPKDVPFIFERFYRVQSPQVQATSGQGLGLALVKAIAERHDGRIWVESRVGQGSIFFLQLPAM